MFLSTLVVPLLLVAADKPFECGDPPTLSKEEPILVYHTVDVSEYTHSPNQRICVNITCKDCPIHVEFTRTCRANVAEEHCPDETKIRLNGDMLAKDACKSSYKDATNATVVEVCTYEVTGDFNFNYDGFYNDYSGTIWFRVEDWLLEEYDYVLRPVTVSAKSVDIVLIDDSPRPSWLILPLSESNPNWFNDMTLTPGCNYDLIIGPPPGKAKPEFSTRKLMTFRAVAAGDFNIQYLESSVFTLLVPPNCPGRIELVSTLPNVGGGVNLDLCEGDTFMVNPGFGTNGFGQSPDLVWRGINCHDSPYDVIIEVETFLDGELFVLNHGPSGAECRNGSYTLDEPIDKPFNYSVRELGENEITWFPGHEKDSFLIKIHITRSESVLPTTTEEAPITTKRKKTTTSSATTTHSTTTSNSNRSSLLVLFVFSSFLLLVEKFL